jgi:protein phosphatase
MAQKFVDRGVLNCEGAEQPPLSHVLWNAVGGEDDGISPAVYKVKLSVGDSLLLCTDGLSKHVPDEGICEELGGNSPAAVVCQNLIDAANRAGGADNITAVVARIPESHEQVEREEEHASLGDALGRTVPHTDLQPRGSSSEQEATAAGGQVFDTARGF